MKVIISPDSFKGTLSSVEAAASIQRAIKQLDNSIETVCLPIADGGEGTLEAFVVSTNGTLIDATVLDPLGRVINAQYGVLGDGETCVIEMAQASGITLVSVEERNPLLSTTYGTGQLIEHALNKGFRKFIIGIGGSATNDAGIGMLHALGVKFLNKERELLPGFVSSLDQLAEIDCSAMHPLVEESQFTIACDVDNPLIGRNGATAVFGPQKGVNPDQIERFDHYLRCFADHVLHLTGIALHDLPGAGAAGGIGGAFKAFFPCIFKQGIDVVMEAVQFENHLKTAQLVITGEGMSDAQTLSGKAPMGIALASKKYDVPTILVSGFVEPTSYKALNALFAQVISVVGEGITSEQSRSQASEYLQKRIKIAMQSKFI